MRKQTVLPSFKVPPPVSLEIGLRLLDCAIFEGKVLFLLNWKWFMKMDTITAVDCWPYHIKCVQVVFLSSPGPSPSTSPFPNRPPSQIKVPQKKKKKKDLDLGLTLKSQEYHRLWLLHHRLWLHPTTLRLWLLHHRLWLPPLTPRLWLLRSFTIDSGSYPCLLDSGSTPLLIGLCLKLQQEPRVSLCKTVCTSVWHKVL